MKRYLCILLLSALMPAALHAQDYRAAREDVARYGYEKPLKYEIRFGVGAYPLFDVNQFYRYQNLGRTSYDSADMDYIYSDYYGAAYTTGSLSAEMNFLVNHWFNVSLCLSDTYGWRATYDGMTGKRKGLTECNTIVFMPQFRFNYLSRRYVKLYSSIAFGAYAGKYNNSWKFGPAFQICPIGVATGRRVFGFTELGAGTRYLGLNAGIGFRF